MRRLARLARLALAVWRERKEPTRLECLRRLVGLMAGSGAAIARGIR